MNSWWTLSNLLSALRAPLAFLFLIKSAFLRCLVIALAGLTDFADGFLARRNLKTSQLGTVLDPAMDKFFVVFVLGVFLMEESLKLSEVAALLCRDLAILLFGLYLYVRREWARYQFRAIWCGKATTALQFAVLMALSLGWVIPSWVFYCFIALGFLALVELFAMARPLADSAA